MFLIHVIWMEGQYLNLSLQGRSQEEEEMELPDGFKNESTV